MSSILNMPPLTDIRIVPLATAFGPMLAAVTEAGLAALERGEDEVGFRGALLRRFPAAELRDGSHPQLARELDEYFAGSRRSFDLDVDLAGLARFDRTALTQVVRIPYGETATYGEVAAELGHPGAARAVGNALSRSPITIVVPCHRVVRAADGLSGWGSNLADKRRLLQLERSVVGSR